ncbi:MAG TPA: hypothetical protein VGG19_20600 [Tepidisphaeraceae bacterium]|jgi:hypothetical protein
MKFLATLGVILLVALIGDRADAQTKTVQFQVNPQKVVGAPWVGFGADMNPYLFCRPNQIDEKSAADLEAKVMALAPQHVRIFFLNSWASGVGDSYVSMGDPRTYESFLRTARIAQKAGATINLTLWYDPAHWKDPAESAHHFAFNLTRLLDAEHLDAIRYVTIQNEPDAYPKPSEPNKITLPKYVQAYQVFDDLLRKWGVRKRVQIIAGDMVADQQAIWVKYLGSKFANIADGYSIHAYWDYWDAPKILTRLNTTEQEFNSLPANQQKPLYITEFGTRGHPSHDIDPGTYEDGRPIARVPIQTMLNAWFMIKAVHDGYVAAVQWEMYDARYDVPMHYGLLGEGKDGWPIKPGYELMKLLTHTCQPGWRAVELNGDTTHITAAAMKSADDQITIWAVNHGNEKSIVTFSGLRPGEEFQLYYWNAHGQGELSPAQIVKIEKNGQITAAIPFHAVIAITGLIPKIQP